MRGPLPRVTPAASTRNPRVRIAVDDGRSFVRRTPERYDVIQASLVDTWAATAAGAYTLTENSLYTVEAFNDYLDHLTDDGVLTITRWVFDGLRLVSLAQAACAARGWDAASQLAIVQHDRVATFLLKKTPFTADEIAHAAATTPNALGLRRAVRAGRRRRAAGADAGRDGSTARATADYARLILAADRAAVLRRLPAGHPADDRRPAVLLPHDASCEDQFQVAFGRSMLFGNGLSALLTLLGISAALVVLFVLGPLVLVGAADRAARLARAGSPTSARSAPASC